MRDWESGREIIRECTIIQINLFYIYKFIS
jgi:hypothetical protein